MRRLCTLMLVVVVALCVVAPAGARPAPRKAMVSWSKFAERHQLPRNWRFFVAIGRCEQPAPADGRKANGSWPERYKWGIHWHQVHNYSFPGGLGVWAPLWEERGISGLDLAPSANRATPIEQMIQAQRIIDKYGKYAWGCTGRALDAAPYYE